MPRLSPDVVSPLKLIAPGVLLLLLAAAGFIYVLARPTPPLESLEPIQLELTKEVPAPTVEPEPSPSPSSSPETVVTRVITAQPPPIKTFAVNILSPSMAETFTAPANVVLRASATRQSELTSIEFFQSPYGTVCQSLTNPVPFPAELKIGEAHAPPYEVTWNIPAAGTKTIVAVATYAGGEKQISPQVVIVVNPAEPFDGPRWKGWRPPYPTKQLLAQDFSLMPAPTPTPTRDSCPAIVVKSFPVASNSNTVNFQATVTGNELPADLKFKWILSAGAIVSGQDTSTISVVFDRILEPRIVAAVEIGRLPAVCPAFGSASVSFEQPPWITKEFRSLLGELAGAITARLKSGTHRYIEIAGARNDCVDEEQLKQARLLRRYLIEYQGAKSEEITIVNGGGVDREWGNFFLRNIDSLQALPDDLVAKLRNPVTSCRSMSSASVNAYGPPLNRTCPDIDEAVSYQTVLRLTTFDRRYNYTDLSNYKINTCPYNPRDPLNTPTQLILDSYVNGGTYSNVPSFEYWANAGKILSKQRQGIWDLSEVKLQPGRYTAIAMADDGCDCTNIETVTATVTNFCSACLTMMRTCSSSPETRGLQFYSAYSEKSAAAKPATFHWTTTRGTIIKGQGTAHIVVDTRGLPSGEKFEVTVAAGGLLPYCVNKISEPAVVEEFECVNTSTSAVFPESYAYSKPARRRPKPEAITRTVEEEEANESPGNGTIDNPPPRLPNEKEWMRILWTPHVKTDQAVTVKVVYNRTTETFQVSDEAGNITEELKLKRPLVEWHGKDYQNFGDLRLVAAGLECKSCDKEQYQSFDNEMLEWSWPLKPEGPGTHSFNLELWVKGEPRDKNSGAVSKPAEKAWTRLENKVVVTDPLLTRQTVYAGSGLCVALGLGLCLRGIKIHRDVYNVGQAVAVGHNVTVTGTTVNQNAVNNNATNKENPNG